jgi:hypothetical protein
MSDPPFTNLSKKVYESLAGNRTHLRYVKIRDFAGMYGVEGSNVTGL